MSKPQTASEPSMEEILSSIRKMIADDRPGPSPIPDQMGRTPFGDQAAKSPAISEFGGRPGSGASPARPAAGQPNNFNSLADALKVATGLSDQRRSLQREIAQVLERGPQAEGFEPLGQPRQTSASPAARKTPDAGAAPSSDKNGSRSQELPGWRDGLPSGEAKRELMSFDFGTVVPQRTDAGAADKAGNGAKTEKVDAKADGSSPEPRIVSMPGRAGALNGTPSNSGLNGHGLNGAAATASPGHPSSANGATVAPFPRTATTPADKPAVKADAATAAEVEAVLKANAAIDKTEALLDAVVDLVQQQPGALSVFTSGASFIGGVGAKKAANPTPAATASPAPAETTDASPGLPAGLPAVPAKLDRAAAELLRPMLRQWLADNMPRIVEEALRSEMTDTVKGDEKSGDKD